MKTLYLDIFSGISGDMFLGAMIDLGVDFHRLEGELAKLGLEGYHLHASRRQAATITGTKFDVHLATDHDDGHGHEHDHQTEEDDLHEHHEDHAHEGEVKEEHEHDHDHKHEDEHEHHHGSESQPTHEHHHAHEHSRTFTEIRELITASPYSNWVKTKAIAIFQRIAVAEGNIHGRPPEQVHFHEVGAIDSIIDIVGACLALEMLGRPRVLAQSVVDGVGWIHCAHGRFPLPAPATLAILSARGVAVSQCEEPHELVTPTGAALLAELVESFGPMQDLVPAKIGYGLGTRVLKTRPNVLRACLAETANSGQDWETDRVAVLETNLDDLSGELLGHFVEIALAAGALDVFHTPIQMKKNRPGVLLTVLCPAHQADQFTELILRETSAFGVRRSLAERRKLRREFKTVETPYGRAMVKIGSLNGQILHATPEYESCRQLAAKAGVALKTVYESVNQSLKP